jgi:hypothetical protein
MHVCYSGVYKNARDWLMTSFDLTEDQAITLLTVACDFNVHQVRVERLLLGFKGNWMQCSPLGDEG